MSTTTFAPTCQQIATDARSKGLWIYEPTQKKWYTPEEFYAQYGHIASGYEPFFCGCQIRDPQEGLKAGFLQMQNLQIKLEDFAGKVATYYRNRKQ